MKELFNDDFSKEDAEQLNVNTEYAKNYDSWRQKEELHKLRTKYGENVDVSAFGKSDEENEESSSSSDDDEGDELDEDFEKTFYKTLACVKNKDPKIYDKDVKFFDAPVKEIKKENVVGEKFDEEEEKMKKKGKKVKEKPMYLRDYERKIIVEKGGKLSDDSDNEDKVKEKPYNPTYVEEQKAIKDSFKKAFEDDEEEEDLLKPKVKTEEEKQKEEENYKEWLKGQKDVIDEENQKNLKPLRDFWTDPNLDENEKFLRDYILNKKFLDKESTMTEAEYDKVAHDSDENLSEDEKTIEQQEEFEHKYNFRFEEPDPEFIKRYPRTMKDCLRKKDNKRALKRAEVKARKEQEMVKKREELKQLKSLKRKEIEEKLEKLKMITGNDDLNIDMMDIDGDFNPEEHDKKMSQIFNDNYYSEEVDDVKPEFPDIDEELEIERHWDYYDPASERAYDNSSNHNVPDCEDPDFNMDADYDGQKNLQDEVMESTKKKKRRRRSKFSEILAKEKPKYDPSKHPSFEKYYDEYYALDYEDMIGDLPCRFKYRKVIPNDFGLTVEEVLLADEKELNRWCSLKRAVQYRPEHAELNDIKLYKQRAANEASKRKILPSLYKPLEEEETEEDKNTDLQNQENQSAKKKRKRRKKHQENGELKEEGETTKKEETQSAAPDEEMTDDKVNIKTAKVKEDETQCTTSAKEIVHGVNGKSENIESNNKTDNSKKNKKKKRKLDKSVDEIVETNMPMKKKKKTSGSEGQQTSELSVEESKFVKSEANSKKKRKIGNQDNQSLMQQSGDDTSKNIETNGVRESIKIKKKNKNKYNPSNNKDETSKSKKELRKEIFKNRQKKKENKTGDEQISHMSAERLKAYGFNPKKFKNKLKYGKKQ